MPTRAPSRPKTTKVDTQSSKARAALALFLILLAAASAFAQSPQPEAPATVTGRVTNGDHGVAGVSVILIPNDQRGRASATARAKTDAEGHYRATNVPPGRYQVLPFAPAYVVEGDDNYSQGKSLTLAAGDVAEGVDFRVERGGVITGRVTDADGSPVIAQQVSISFADNNPDGRRRGVGTGFSADPRSHMTDDRGVYRIYGLPAGRYHVSAGNESGGGAISYGRRKLYQRTFYPDATDESQAQVVEVSEGSEAENVDIRLGSPVKTYKASGRFVEAETGRPVPNVAVGYGALDAAGQRVTSFGSNTMTDARGEFVAEGLAPGHYAAFVYPFASPQDTSDFYSDPTTFDVTDSDVTGVVVTLRHGSTLTGVVAVEGTSDGATIARIAKQVQLFSYYDAQGQQVIPTAVGYPRQTVIAPDGSFRMTGVRPGKVRLMVSGQVKGLTLSRVEINGANVTNNGIDVAAGSQVSGVRVVVTYGSGLLRGQLNATNGTISPAAHLTAFARRVSGGEDQGWHSGEVDARGRFEMQGLAPGEYDVHVQGVVPNTPQRYQSEHQFVAVSEGTPANVTLSLDLSAPQNKGGRP
jgi:hypothetical protein